MIGRVAGRVAMVTGAAGGIGQAIARRFGQEGARLVLSDIDADLLAPLAAELEMSGNEAIALSHDVREEAGWERVMAAVEQRFGTLDILVNNAGVAAPAPTVFEDITLAQ